MSNSEFQISRQTVLASAGLGAVAVALSSCSTYGQQSESSETSAADSPAADSPAADSPAADAPEPLATTADVPVGSGVIVDNVVITQPTDGVFKGFSTTCTHSGCQVNAVANGTIDCPCHGSKFNLDGTVAAGPATRPLDAVAITVEGDSILPA